MLTYWFSIIYTLPSMYSPKNYPIINVNFQMNYRQREGVEKKAKVMHI